VGGVIYGRDTFDEASERDKTKDVLSSDGTLSNLTSLLEQDTDQLTRARLLPIALQPHISLEPYCSGHDTGHHSSSGAKRSINEIHRATMAPQSDLSEGEVPVIVKKGRLKDQAEVESSHTWLGHELRDGIDVISVKTKSRVSAGHLSHADNFKDFSGTKIPPGDLEIKSEASDLSFTPGDQQEVWDKEDPDTFTRTQRTSQFAGSSTGEVKVVISTAAEAQPPGKTYPVQDQLPTLLSTTVSRHGTPSSITEEISGTAEEISETFGSTDV